MGVQKVAVLLAGFAAGCLGEHVDVPSIEVPSCSSTPTTISFDTSVPDKTAFPLTTISLCYDTSALQLNFTAYKQSTLYFDPDLTTNEEIYNFTVMEAFISRGTGDPQTYLEFEVAPNNVTYNAFVYNPSKVRADGAVFDHFFIEDPEVVGLLSSTTVEPAEYGGDLVWQSDVRIPLGLFNVDDGEAAGTKWRMNFFRTTYDETTGVQGLGGWSVPNKASFHITPYFGNAEFV